MSGHAVALFNLRSSRILKATCRSAIPLAIAATLIAGVGAPAGATSADETDYTDFSLSELLQTDVVYGASKFEQQAKDAPSSITIVTAEEIRGYGYRNLAAVLGSVRGFYLTYDRNYSYIGTRGFGRPGDFNSRILVMVDGVRINENIYDAASVDNEFPVDSHLIKQIEIVRGPSSSLYGTSAIFAIVNIITKSAHEFGTVEVRGNAGSYGTYSGHVTLADGDESGNRWYLSGSMGVSEGQDHYFPEFDTPETNNGIFGDGDRESWQHVFGKVESGSFHLEGTYGWQNKRVPTAPWNTMFNHNGTQTWDKVGFASAWYDGDIGDQTRLLTRLSFNSARYEGAWIYDWADVGEEPWPVAAMDNSKSEWLTVESQVTREIAGGHLLLFGGEYRNNLRQDQAVWDAEPYWLYTDDQRDSEISAVYALGEWRASERLRLNLGVRYDHYSTFGSSTNPRLAALFRAGEGTLLKAIYGSAFRAPNAYELYYNDGGVTTKGNPGLAPETIRTFEVVLEQQLGQSLHGSVSAFRYKNTDLIDQIEDPVDNLGVYINNSEVEANGVELEMRTQLESGLKSVASYTYTKVEMVDPREILSNSPQQVFKFKALVPVRTLTTTLGFELRHETKRRTWRGDFTDGFTLANVTLVHAPLNWKLELTGGVYNLFDTTYATPGGTEHEQIALEQDGRSFRVGFNYRP